MMTETENRERSERAWLGAEMMHVLMLSLPAGPRRARHPKTPKESSTAC
jgi:hypothetical protein